jgi:phospho-N-acetylmuramoyl-pentapeptide-transferase
MLFWLTELSDGGGVFNLFRYITFRAGGAFLTALVFGFAFGPALINVLRRRQGKGQRSAPTGRSRTCRRPARPPWGAS